MRGSHRRSRSALLFTAAPPLDHQVRPRASRVHSTVVGSSAARLPTERNHQPAGRARDTTTPARGFSRTSRVSSRTPSSSRLSPEAWQMQPRPGTQPQLAGGPLPARSGPGVSSAPTRFTSKQCAPLCPLKSADLAECGAEL
ncbi:hypothetical protein NDU88_002352 [Pleurodeles waltl]|uniref:Uncharacterized protein n=1 Tax=Pleurodeles waltl TaxID=8319 RepID=A0AAV7U9D8_PLEWA|nr:hypothetical protein NDU88_002352 [Pleurodeles waltl]